MALDEKFAREIEETYGKTADKPEQTEPENPQPEATQDGALGQTTDVKTEETGGQVALEGDKSKAQPATQDEKPDEYLPDKPPDNADPLLKKQYADAVKGITKKFTALQKAKEAMESEYRSKHETLAKQEADIAKIKADAEQIERAMLDAVSANPELFAQLPFDFILKNHPQGKEYAERLKAAESAKEDVSKAKSEQEKRVEEIEDHYNQLYAAHQALQIRSQLKEWGYSDADIKTLGTERAKDLDAVVKQLESGFELPFILKNLGYGPKGYTPPSFSRAVSAPPKKSLFVTKEEKLKAIEEEYGQRR